jgi:hypothetical protein
LVGFGRYESITCMSCIVVLCGFGAALELRSNCLKLSQPVEGKSPQQDFLGQGPELNSESKGIRC